MKKEYNFTEEEAWMYHFFGVLPTRINPIIGKKIADAVDKQIFKELSNKFERRCEDGRKIS